MENEVSVTQRFVRKRNGKIVEFDQSRITKAIESAVKATKGDQNAEELSDQVVKELARKYPAGRVLEVEEIQDVVEDVLVKAGHTMLAKAYILYRRQHQNIREFAGVFKDIMIIDDYINENDWRVKENSNMTFSLQGLNFHISGIVVKNYWLNRIYFPEIAKAHETGDLHIHDLSILGAYCVGWDLQDLLVTGFKGVSGKVEAKPAKHLRAALGQVVNFFYTLQGEAAGAQAMSSIDTLLAPFIRADSLSYKQLKQAIQEFLYNVNVPTRVGFQTPFTNITLDLTVPNFLANMPAVIGGKFTDKTYADYQEEVDMFNKAFAEVMLDGDAKGRPFTFPIPTYNISKDFDYDNPALEPVWEMTAKYGIPYFANFVNSDMSPEDARSMCCRLRLDKRELKKRGGGLFGADPLTGSIGVVTLNLPRLAYLSKDETEFQEKIREMMDLGMKSLEIKRKVIEGLTEKGLYPYSKFYLRSIKEATGKYWTNHFSTIGLVGMNEAMLNLIGKDLTDKDAIKLAEKTLEFMRDKLADYQETTGNMYNLEATPAEGTSYRLARLNKKYYPKLIVANESDWKKGAEPYHTNSSQLPVYATSDLFKALELQDGLQTKYTGGTVLHIFVGERMPNPESAKKLVKTIAENYKLPYYTISPTFSVCPNHGYLAGEHFTCPTCNAKTEVYSRIVGYIRPVQQWNDGKQAEFNQRKTFQIAGKGV